MTKEISVAVVEDNNDIRDAYKEIISLSEGYQLIGSFENGEKAIVELPTLKPDVVLMDIRLGEGISGIEVVKKLKPIMPLTSFIMSTVYDSDEYILDSINAGASGYLSKASSPNKMLITIVEIYNGDLKHISQIKEKVILEKESNMLNHALTELTKREIEILEYLKKGYLVKEISKSFGISLPTIRKHLSNIYRKLHVTNRRSAIEIFLE